MKPYKLKHVPTGLYYQPHKHRGSNLSQKGKIYQSATHWLSSAENDAVTKIKNKTAELIDDLQAIKNDEVSKTYELSEDVLIQISGEKLRLIALAQTTYEKSCMWAEKALTI